MLIEMVSLHNYTCFRCLTAGTTTQWCLGNILVEISFTTYSHLLTRVTKMHLIVTCSPWKIYKWWSMRGQLLFCKLHHRQIIEFWRSRYRILKDFTTCMLSTFIGNVYYRKPSAPATPQIWRLFCLPITKPFRQTCPKHGLLLHKICFLPARTNCVNLRTFGTSLVHSLPSDME